MDTFYSVSVSTYTSYKETLTKTSANIETGLDRKAAQARLLMINDVAFLLKCLTAFSR